MQVGTNNVHGGQATIEKATLFMLADWGMMYLWG